MNNIKTLLCVGSFFVMVHGLAQTVGVTSNKIAFDFSDPKKNYSSSVPNIIFNSPESPVTYLKEGKLDLTILIESRHDLKAVSLVLIEKQTRQVETTSKIPINDQNRLSVKIHRSISLPDGIHEIEVIAENKDGLRSMAGRTVHVGATVFADASKLNRTDYALVFATDIYDNWQPLTNPVFDGKTIAKELETYYGFKAEVVENASQEEIFNKLHEYAIKKYEPLDQLLIFFAGHGYFDEAFKEGYVVARESLKNDPGKTSFIRHSTLGSTISNNPCEHIFLVMDVCFSGTFGQASASRKIDDEIYGEPSQSDLIIKKLKYKTRKYLTSGGKEYVPDGTPGNHSPFAKKFIEALTSRGGSDGILTLNELMTYVEKIRTTPKYGGFGSDKQGSEFVFVVR